MYWRVRLRLGVAAIVLAVVLGWCGYPGAR